MGIAQRPWDLSPQKRALIVFSVFLYLLLFHPWDRPNPSIAANVYGGAAAMLSLAALPRRARLIHAICVAFVVAFIAFEVAFAVLRAQA